MKKSAKVRISLDCSAEERRLIKALASLEDMTISDYILNMARSKMAQFSSLGVVLNKGNESKSESDDSWNSFLEGIAKHTA